MFELLISFLQIGAFSIGGGYATRPNLRRFRRRSFNLTAGPDFSREGKSRGLVFNIIK